MFLLAKLSIITVIISLFLSSTRCSSIISKINEVVSEKTCGKPTGDSKTCDLPPISGFGTYCRNLISPFPECSCPPGQALLIDFNRNLASCIKTCFGVSTVTCNGQSIAQCLGSTTPLVTCSLSRYLNNYVCSNSCGDLLILPDGSFYCIQLDDAVAPTPGSTCPNGFVPLCTPINYSSSCLSVSSNDLQPLYQQLSCQDCN